MPFDQQEFDVEVLRPFRPTGRTAEAPTANPIDIGAERLRILADFLDALPRERFDMSSWDMRDGCGSAGCALGWAGKIPAFVEAGYSCVTIPQFKRGNGYEAAAKFFGFRSEGEAQRFFNGVSRARKLESARSVVARIREHLADRAIASRRSHLAGV